MFKKHYQGNELCATRKREVIQVVSLNRGICVTKYACLKIANKRNAKYVIKGRKRETETTN